MRPGLLVIASVIAAILLSLSDACTPPRRTDTDINASTLARQEPFEARPFRAASGGLWIGNAISYSPFRDGQYPGGPSPTRAELRQDLELVSAHWRLIRMYSAVGAAETVLDIIREHGLGIKVLLGVWIDVEQKPAENGVGTVALPDAQRANRREVEAAIRLARDYSEMVLAISVGNETQVFWSAHRSPMESLIRFVREVRSRTTVPVAVADDFNFWNKPESRDVVREIDFIMMHAHPLWNGLSIDDALSWTLRMVLEVQTLHPGHTVVLGETGWATQKHNEGEQATLIKGQPGEEQQKIFYDAVNRWAQRERIVTFFFEAFDENWKGGDHPNEVEKHWGLYRSDRTPKKAVTDDN